jgi:hypothetical protein
MPWSMKIERELIQLAGSGLKTEQIATKLKISPQAVIKIGRRVGLGFPPLEIKRNGRRTADGEVRSLRFTERSKLTTRH